MITGNHILGRMKLLIQTLKIRTAIQESAPQFTSPSEVLLPHSPLLFLFLFLFLLSPSSTSRGINHSIVSTESTRRPIWVLVLIQLTFWAWQRGCSALKQKKSQIDAARSLEYKAEWHALVACCAPDCLENFPAGAQTTVEFGCQTKHDSRRDE